MIIEPTKMQQWLWEWGFLMFPPAVEWVVFMHSELLIDLINETPETDSQKR